mgnify:CR=1 FL=1
MCWVVLIRILLLSRAVAPRFLLPHLSQDLCVCVTMMLLPTAGTVFCYYCRLTGPSQPQGQTSSSPSSKQQQDTPTEPHSAGAQEGSDDSRPVSGFGDYGCDSGTTTSCSSMDTDPDSITEDCCEVSTRATTCAIL